MAAGRNGWDEAIAVAIDGWGRIVVSGTALICRGDANVVLWRYTSAGTLDTSFNTDGSRYTACREKHRPECRCCRRIRTHRAGRIHKNSSNKNAMTLWRYGADGTPDTTFGGSGIITQSNSAGVASDDNAMAVAIDGSGTIVAAGQTWGSPTSDMALWRYKEDISGVSFRQALDTTFDTDGLVAHNGAAGGTGQDYAAGVAIDGDGRIVAAGSSVSLTSGSDMVLWRYNKDGTLDTSFNSTGIATHNGAAGGNGNDYGSAAVIDGFGKIVVVGMSQNVASGYDMAVWRYNINGTLDTTFFNNQGTKRTTAQPII
jgi:uncharacterized delta-60 repeat protein